MTNKMAIEVINGICDISYSTRHFIYKTYAYIWYTNSYNIITDAVVDTAVGNYIAVQGNAVADNFEDNLRTNKSVNYIKLFASK